VRTAKAKTKPVKLFDDRGFFLLVTLAWGKWWRLRYHFDGKEKLRSLSAYPDTPPELAPESRENFRQLIAQGKPQRKIASEQRRVSRAHRPPTRTPQDDAAMGRLSRRTCEWHCDRGQVWQGSVVQVATIPNREHNLPCA
jgi:hypothetical protein